MKLTLIEKKPEADQIVSFRFHPEQPVTWQPGQFLIYTLPHSQADDKGIERFFTIASTPKEGFIQLTTRVQPGESTFKDALAALPIGAVVETSEPQGDFCFTTPDKEFVFIAGGIGITPFRAILLDLQERKQKIAGTLLYANRDARTVVFQKELEELAKTHPDFSIRYVFSPQRIDKASLPSLVADFSKPQFFVSGPEPMVESLETVLMELGVTDERLHRDYFPGYNWP